MSGSNSVPGETFTSDQFTFSERDAYAVIAEISNVSTLGVALKASQNVVNENNEAKDLVALLQMEGISGYSSQVIADPTEISNKVGQLELLAANYIRAIAEINNCDAQSAVAILQNNFDPNIDWTAKDIVKLTIGITAVLTLIATPWPDEWLATSIVGGLGLISGAAGIATSIIEYVGEEDASTMMFAVNVLLSGLPLLPGAGSVGAQTLARMSKDVGLVQNELKLLVATRAAALQDSAYISPLAVFDYPAAASDIAAIFEISKHDAEELLSSTQSRIHSQQAFMDSINIKVDGTGSGIINTPSVPTGEWTNENRLEQWFIHHGVTHGDAQTIMTRNLSLIESEAVWNKYPGLIDKMPPDLQTTLMSGS